jgi:hypothetical protein
MDIQYTKEMGEAAEKYLYRCNRFAHPLPQQFRWEECLNEMLTAAPTPPEVEPVAWKITWPEGTHGATNKVGLVCDHALLVEARKAQGAIITPLYTSPPSPKASWDAEGNPLNLEAAARDLVDKWNSHCLGHKYFIENLRKFLGGS